MRGSEIAVVARSLPAVAPLLESVFAQYGIAVRRGGELPLSHTPLGRALRGAVRCALADEQRPAPRTCSITCAPRGCSRAPRSPTSSRHGSGARACARSPRRAPACGRSSPRTAGLRRRRTRPPSSTRSRRPRSPPASCAVSARRLFAAPHPATAPLLDDADALDARALGTLARALNELDQLDLAPAGAELVELLDELVVAPGAGNGDERVLLAEPLEIRARRFRAVFVCGLQEGAFPLPSRPEPFLSDERRRELAICSGLRLRAAEETLDRERYLLYTTLSRATERIFLSYRSSDEEGNVALPSPFIADVAELFVADWPRRRRRRLLADVVWEPREAPTDRELARSIAAARAPTMAISRARAHGSAALRSSACATSRSCPPGRSSRMPTAPSSGSSSASCDPRRSNPSPRRSCAAASCTTCSSGCSPSSAGR